MHFINARLALTGSHQVRSLRSLVWMHSSLSSCGSLVNCISSLQSLSCPCCAACFPYQYCSLRNLETNTISTQWMIVLYCVRICTASFHDSALNSGCRQRSWHSERFVAVNKRAAEGTLSVCNLETSASERNLQTLSSLKANAD